MWRRWWKTTMATRWIRCSSTTQMGTWLRYATVRTSQSYPSLPAHSSPERVCTTLLLLDIISVDLRRIWWWISADSWRLWWWSLSIRTWWTFHSKACLCWRDEEMKRWGVELTALLLLQMYLLLLLLLLLKGVSLGLVFGLIQSLLASWCLW